MSQSYICEKCGSTSYEQFSQTQVKCMQCGNVSFYDTGYRVPRQFELSPDNNILDFVPKVNYRKAPLGKRLANYILDVFFMMMLVFFTMTLATLFSAKLSENSILGCLLLLMPGYYIGMEYKFGKTLGKFITRTKVISTTGNPLTFGQSVGRTFCRIIPFERFSGLFTEGVFWHDSIPKTVVVEDEVML